MTKLHFGRVCIEPGGILLLGGLIYFTGWMGTLRILLAALWHEMGHLLAAGLVRCKVHQLSFCATGFRADVDTGRLSYPREAAVYLGGPLAGVLLSAVTAGWDAVLSGISLGLSLLNLLPVTGLDGGGIMRCLLTGMLGADRGERAEYTVSLFVTTGLCILGILSAALKGNWAALGAAIWLWEKSFLLKKSG